MDAESDQRHAQHPLKMLGIDFSCGSYQTNSERVMVLNSWSNWHVFIFYPLPFCRIENRWAEMTATYFAQGYVISSPLTSLVRLATMHNCTKVDRRRNANSNPLFSQYLSHSVLNNVRGRYEECIVLGNKDVWIRWMSWASYWWSRDLRWRQRWSKGGTITRTRDEKRRIGTTEMSVGISKSINTDFILK